MTAHDLPDLEAFEDCFVNNADLERVSGYLNRFNPIRVMRMEHMEIRHSAILAWLLDPVETHGFDDRFLRAFLSQALRRQSVRREPSALDVAQADLRDAEIRREKHNIDLFVTSPGNGWAFVIENKFHSKQHNGQLKRYLDHAKGEAEDAGLTLKHRGIFLTLHEEDPDENVGDDYVSLRYEDICNILDALMADGGVKVAPEVRQFISHYLEIIKDAAGMNEEQMKMEILAKQLYRKHKKVLNFIMEHGAVTEFTMAAESLFGSDLEYGDEVEIDGAQYMYSWNSDHQYSFIPVSWRKPLGGKDKIDIWEGCESWWARYPLICWFELYEDADGMKGRLRLFAEVGPLSNFEHRKKLIKGIKRAADRAGLGEVQFRADAEREGARYSKFLKSTANSILISDVSDLEVE
ncbi:PD-(D/E)XK nuclease family protein [Paracoccus mangrovi]|uniref:PD-(D/E)XK nuclease family protein n=1 Tax=Paracoccus mangrovi TaxID=1715645 RepID=A0ABV7QX47_9RHOB